MEKACLTLFKIKGFIDCLNLLNLNPKLRISAHPVFNRHESPEIPQTNGLVIPAEDLSELFEIHLTGVEIVYDYFYGVIDLRTDDSYYSIPIEYIQAVVCSQFDPMIIHNEPTRFISVFVEPKLKLVK